MKRSGLAAILAFLACAASAQPSLEIIPLRHRTAEQVLPVLRPLLEPGATLTGQRSQLNVRTSPANLAELRQALVAIYRPLRRLQIAVRFDESGDFQGRDIEARGRVSNRGAEIGIRADERHARRAERVDQQIQVLEGGRAFIMTGSSRPVPGGVWDTATGFEAVPRLSGEMVLVDIAPQKESFERQQRMATTVSARLGEWFEVGGAHTRGTFSGSEMRRVWLKIEVLP
jgi:hypothetical protein